MNENNVQTEAGMTNPIVQAMELLENGEVDAGLDALQQEANSGNTEAKFELGLLYFYGDILPTDEDLAYEWLAKANEDGHIKAPLYLGSLCTASSIKWFERGADRGHDVVMTRLGMMYLYGIGVRQSKAKSLEYFKKAMEAGHLFGHVQYARLLILGQKGFGGFFLGFYELFRGLYKTAKYAAKHSPEEIRPKISR